MSRRRFSPVPLLAVVCLLMSGCHEGEEHALYDWEMVIPYSPAVGSEYPMIGAITRYDSLADCRKARTSMIRTRESHHPPGIIGEQTRASILLLRENTWCLPAWPNPSNWDEPTMEGGIAVRGMLDTPANKRRLEAWMKR